MAWIPFPARTWLGKEGKGGPSVREKEGRGLVGSEGGERGSGARGWAVGPTHGRSWGGGGETGRGAGLRLVFQGGFLFFSFPKHFSKAFSK